jgi:hypothetical protein
MSESTLWFLLAICGLATLLIGLAIFLFVAVTRLSGRGLLGFMNFLVGRANDKQYDQLAENELAQAPQPDFEAIARAKSFDEALRARQGTPPGQPFSASSAPSASRFNPGFPTGPASTPPATPRLDNLPPIETPDLRPRRSSRAEDDAVGAFLDE